MSKVFCFFVLVTCCWIAFIPATSSRLLDRSGSLSKTLIRQDEDPLFKDWDSLVFTVQWPVTTCLEWKEKVANNTCILPDDTHLWTIHGLWPTKTGTEGPAFCNNSWVFDINKVKDLVPEMMKLWPNIHGGDTVDSLWKHEWSKHGTCAALHPRFATEALYFHSSLGLAEKYHVQKILSAGNIKPSLTVMYKSTDIWQVLRDGLGVSPAISCDSDRKTGAYYVSEIKLCFSPDLELIGCEGKNVYFNSVKLSGKKTSATYLLGNCPAKKGVYYPGAVSVKPKLKRKPH